MWFWVYWVYCIGCLCSNFAVNVYLLIKFFGILEFYFELGYGTDGLALATFLTIFFFNSVKLWFVQYRFKMNPFMNKTLSMFLIIVVLNLWSWDNLFTILDSMFIEKVLKCFQNVRSKDFFLLREKNFFLFLLFRINHILLWLKTICENTSDPIKW